MSIRSSLIALPLLARVALAQQKQSFDISNLPHTWEEGQTGYNDCGSTNSQSSMCQTAHINSLNDFCLWGPPTAGVTIGDSEEYQVAWCTSDGHGTRTIPQGAITGAHYLETEHYTQITGVGDLTGLNIRRGDDGGETDPHGSTGFGNPRGGLVYANGQQIKEWTSFIADTEFCFRICKDAPDSWLWCQHIYDIQGCHWNEPGNYNQGFDSCQGDSTEQPPGIYIVDGKSSTYQQSQGPAPSAHPAGKSSNCQQVASLDIPVTRAAAAPTTAQSSALSSAQPSSAQSSSTSVSSSSVASSSGLPSASTSSTPSSFMMTSTTSSSSALLSSTSSSLPVLTVTSTTSSPSATSATVANNVAASASSSARPVSGASRMAVSVGGSLAAFVLGLVLCA